MGQMTEAVAAALDARTAPSPLDGAADQLARTYAALMDEAAPAGKYGRALSTLTWAVDRVAAEDEGGNDVTEALRVVALALAEHSVASDLGPKLAAILDKLGLTTSARNKADTGGVNDAPPDALEAIRQRRAGRAGARVPG